MPHIYRKNHIVTPKKEVVNVFNLGYSETRKRLSSAKIITTLQREEKP